ncbi:MAG: S46 family peptidase [Gemmatimonadota bacterium]
MIAAMPFARSGLVLSLLLALGCAGSPAAEPVMRPMPEAGPVATNQEPDLAVSQPPEAAGMPEPAMAVQGLDTVRAGQFDNGRMWTFEYPPTEYFASTYGFDPNTRWFEHARLGALRIPGCSASFVSPTGLVMTNHHCARDHVSAVSKEGETLLDDGFFAMRQQDERAIEDFEADRLVEIRDVTDEVRAAEQGIMEDEARSEARQAKIEALEESLLEEFGGEDGGHHIEIISLYDGGRYSAYIFRRYTDVRLVMAPELQIGFFGGDPDNFTYPRYNLDMSFLRVYDNGQPLDTRDNYFRWSTAGVKEGDAVFVIGNPGSTSRIQTVAELEFRRDVGDKGVLDFIDSRIEVLEAYYARDPETAERLDLRNEIFSLQNSQKSYRGVIEGLYDPVILAKRQDSEQKFLDAIEADPSLKAQYSGLVQRMAELQDAKRAYAPGFGSFLAFTTPAYGSATLSRVLPAFQYLGAKAQGAPPEALQEALDEFLAVPDYPAELDEMLIEARFEDLIRNYGEDDPQVQALLQGRSAEGAAALIVQGTMLADSAGAAEALQNGTLNPMDPAMSLVQRMFGLIGPFQEGVQPLGTEEEEIKVKLGQARFAVYGTTVPPDATFSLRIADGVVSGYRYNGTLAPTHTTFYGFYDRYYSFNGVEGGDNPWALPTRWQKPPASFDLSTPLNFVSTADIIGGNSGSPVVNKDLEVVGLVFDGNIESLPGDYIYLTETARSVAVDARGILEALRDIYGLRRIADELEAGARAGAR